MHRIATLTIAFILLAAAYAQTPQQIARSAFESTVTILVFDAAGQALGLGSGFLVGPELVVTNAHVVAGATRLLVRPVGVSNTIPAITLEHWSETADLAVLRVPGLTNPALALSGTAVPSVGATIYAVGSPLGLDGTFTQGIVSGFRTVEGLSLMQITAPISPGSSGGPVLDDRGAVVGVAVGAFTEGQNLNFAIPVTTLQALLAQAPISRAVATLAGERAQPSAPGDAQGLVEAVTVRNLGVDFADRLSISLINNLPRPIRNVEVLVVAYDREGYPIDTYTVQMRDSIMAGLARHMEVRLASRVAAVLRSGTVPIAGVDVARTEFRVLSFKYAD